ncbi:hypothetical protein BCR33DRAFT_718101 [Rhizoclosmatium globosum]|uniref:Uncharacterized protein n=1 Tax=Rhizoclosmatium globosum TaxID=329046 RepID=A0A1Y2C775_9FUNG|nr:hypothetical protein BCR33DRAFT_718101 [Rhizoclosmatium globosum]|eukprot:ORY42881.1 hypothetical protein BCR33DRAFT_718101 [Rhizoclosmatium globosum]
MVRSEVREQSEDALSRSLPPTAHFKLNDGRIIAGACVNAETSGGLAQYRIVRSKSFWKISSKWNLFRLSSKCFVQNQLFNTNSDEPRRQFLDLQTTQCISPRRREGEYQI